MLRVIAEKAVSTTVSLLKKSIAHVAKNASVLWTVETVGEGKVLRFNHKLACTVDAGNAGHSNSHYQAWLYRLPRDSGKINSEALESMLFESLSESWDIVAELALNAELEMPNAPDQDWFSNHWCMLPDDLKKVSVIKQSDFFEIK